jgi:hypothetical protein
LLQTLLLAFDDLVMLPAHPQEITDPDNFESNMFGTKCKADSAGDKDRPQCLRKAAPDDIKDAGEPSDGDAGHATETSEFDIVELTDKATSDDDVEDAEECYAATKALGDADRKVSFNVYIYSTLH